MWACLFVTVLMCACEWMCEFYMWAYLSVCVCVCEWIRGHLHFIEWMCDQVCVNKWLCKQNVLKFAILYIAVTKATCRFVLVGNCMYVLSCSEWCDRCLSFLPTTSNKQLGGPSDCKNRLYICPISVPVYHKAAEFQCRATCSTASILGEIFLGQLFV